MFQNLNTITITSTTGVGDGIRRKTKFKA